MSRKHKRKSANAVPSSRRPLRISVITPSFNTGEAIEAAIQSVLAQDYPHFEHWIVDGGSTDGTLDILKRYPHLKWVSEPDKGQSDAMNKGFGLSSGEIVVYLNADDLLAAGAFSTVIPLFERGAQVVMGRVSVIQENDASDWINDPKTDFLSMLRHWELDAFCVNPVGYYYRRAVQETVPFNLANDDKMDLEFLLGVASRFPIAKVERILGTFNFAARCKTGREQTRLDYWRPENFPFIEALLTTLPEQQQAQYQRQRETGYQVRRTWTLEALARDEERLDRAWRTGEALALPADELTLDPSAVADATRWMTVGDTVVVVLSFGDTAMLRAAAYLRGLPLSSAPFPVYVLPGRADDVVTQALRAAFAQHGDRLRWRFIAAGGGAARAFLADNFGLTLPVGDGDNLDAAVPGLERKASRSGILSFQAEASVSLLQLDLERDDAHIQSVLAAHLGLPSNQEK